MNREINFFVSKLSQTHIISVVKQNLKKGVDMSTTQIPAFGKIKHLSRIFMALTKQFFVPGKVYKLDNVHSCKALEIVNGASQEVTISFRGKERVWSFVLFIEKDIPIISGMTLHSSEIDDWDDFNCPINIDELIANLEEAKK